MTTNERTIRLFRMHANRLNANNAATLAHARKLRLDPYRFPTYVHRLRLAGCRVETLSEGRGWKLKAA